MPQSKPPRSPHPRFFIRPATRNRKSLKQNHSSVYNTYLCEPSWCSNSSSPDCAQPAGMSSITPQSFVDDGGSFTKRVPHGLDQRRVAKRISGGDSDVSGYTGSYIDDGADMRVPQRSAPGFGEVNTKFYKQRKQREEKDAIWNDDVQKAISGDIQRNLAKLRGLGGVRVKRTDREHSGEGKEKDEKKEEVKDTVTIAIPPQWGTFVIKAEDGRVIIVGKDGEFDSGPQKAPSEPPERWVKAPSTIVSPSPTEVSHPPSPPKHRTTANTSKDHTEEKQKEKESRHEGKKHKHKKSHHSHLLPPVKALTPISESEYEDGYLPSGGEDIGSPTGFMMTGGASGWPSTAVKSVVSPASSVGGGYDYMIPNSPVRSISQGYRYVIPDSDGYEYAIPDTPSKSKPASPVRSPPGSWPPPPVSPVKSKSKALSENSWSGSKYEDAWKVISPTHSHRSKRSHRTSKSEKSHRSRKHEDTHSVKSHSTYRAPTVEDAANTSSEEKEDYIKTGWGGSVDAASVQSWKGSQKGSPCNSKHGSFAGWNSPTKPASEQSWSSRPKAADNPSWTGIEPSSFAQHPTSPLIGSPAHPSSEATWDGFERAKTSSDGSVVGTGSKRSEPGSRVSRSSRHSHGSRSSRREEPVGWDDAGSHRRHRSSRHEQPTGWEGGGSRTSHKSHQSHRSRTSQERTDWEDKASQISHQSWGSKKSRAEGDGWEASGQTPHEITWGSPRGSESGWMGSKAGSDRGGGKYKNGFDESNETYLNGNWGGVPVRVGGSPKKTSVVGWD